MPSRAGESLYAPWHEGLAQDEVRITRCARCERWQWYPTLWCPACGGEEWDWVPVEPRGRVVSWVRVVRPTVAFPEVELPYVLGLVELPHAGNARVPALAASGERPGVGDLVNLECRSLADRGTLYLVNDG